LPSLIGLNSLSIAVIMSAEASSLRVLIEVPNEIEATLIANDLEAEGITTTLTGINTAAFRAEAPGVVSVMVRLEDLDRARQIMVNVHNRAADADWEHVDVGQPE
jgi:Putative prokaryotic signal transducing protein